MDELQRAQESLGRALERARAGDDPRLAALVRERGEAVGNLLTGLLRMGRVHAPTNKAFDQPVKELHGALSRLVDLVGTVHVVAVEDQVYINEVRVRQATVKDGKGLAAELAPHHVGGLTFHAVPDDPQLRALLGLFHLKPAAERPRAALQQKLREAGVHSVELAVIHRFKLAGEEVPDAAERKDHRRVQTKALSLVGELWDNLAAGRQPNVLPLRRVVTDLLELGPGAEPFWSDVTGAAPHAMHAFRVCQHALVLGQAAGLSTGVLQDLGVAALVHDVGYAVQPPPPFEGHPAAGARLLLKQRGFHEAKVRRALVALEHHLDFKGPYGTPALFSRIVRVADDYEALVRLDGGNVPPPTALGCLAGAAGARYDPVLLQLFLNRMGAFPPRTFLRLEDGRIGLSVSLVRGPETFAAPRVAVVREADGSPPRAFTVVDVARGEARVAEILRPGG